MSPKRKNGDGLMSFDSISQDELPFGRKGKHHKIISDILSDLDSLNGTRALKIPLDGLSDSKANIRAALSRAAKLRGVNVVTSSDDNYLYVWKASKGE